MQARVSASFDDKTASIRLKISLIFNGFMVGIVRVPKSDGPEALGEVYDAD
jgi:hypothetical protein